MLISLTQLSVLGFLLRKDRPLFFAESTRLKALSAVSQPACSKFESQALFLPSHARGQADKEVFPIIGFLLATSSVRSIRCYADKTAPSPPSNNLFTLLSLASLCKKHCHLMPVVDFLSGNMQVRWPLKVVLVSYKAILLMTILSHLHPGLLMGLCTDCGSQPAPQ